MESYEYEGLDGNYEDRYEDTSECTAEMLDDGDDVETDPIFG